MKHKVQKATVAIVAIVVFFATFIGTSREQVVVEAKKIVSDSNNINNNYLIGSQTLESILSNKNLVILDIRDSKEYNQGHIPGAINVSWNQFIDKSVNNSKDKNSILDNSTNSSNTNENNLKINSSNNTNNSKVSNTTTTEISSQTTNWTNGLNKKELTKELQTLGINQNSQVVIYGDSNGDDLGDLGKFSWMFRMIGINSKMLNGGFKNWESQGFATTTESTKPKSSNIEIENFVKAKSMGISDIEKNISKIKIVELVNNVKQISGDSNSVNSNPNSPNHNVASGNAVEINTQEQDNLIDPPVQGVTQIKLSELLNPNGTIKPIDSLQNIFESKGIQNNDIILFYNTDTGNLAFLSLILNMAGYNNIENCNASLTQVVNLSQAIIESENVITDNGTNPNNAKASNNINSQSSANEKSSSSTSINNN